MGRAACARLLATMNTRLLPLCFVAFLLLQSALPGALPVARAAPERTVPTPANNPDSIRQPFPQYAPQPATQNAPLAQREEHEPGVVVEPPPEIDVEPFVAVQPVPLLLQIESDRAILPRVRQHGLRSTRGAQAMSRSTTARSP